MEKWWKEIYKHSLNVADLSVLLAEKVNQENYGKNGDVLPVFENDLIENIYTGCLLHDIGKMKIPPETLFKETPLTKKEYNLIKTHTLEGYQMFKKYIETNETIFECFDGREIKLEEIDFNVVLNIIKSHHEKNDGSGYPEGLSMIHNYIQLVSICDIFESLISKRSYKKAFTLNKTIKILNEEVLKGKLNKDYVEILSKYKEEFYSLCQ